MRGAVGTCGLNKSLRSRLTSAGEPDILLPSGSWIQPDRGRGPAVRTLDLTMDGLDGGDWRDSNGYSAASQQSRHLELAGGIQPGQRSRGRPAFRGGKQVDRGVSAPCTLDWTFFLRRNGAGNRAASRSPDQSPVRVQNHIPPCLPASGRCTPCASMTELRAIAPSRPGLAGDSTPCMPSDPSSAT